MSFFSHICNGTCFLKNTDGEFRCQKLYIVRLSNDNKNHQFMPLPNDYSVVCLKIIQHVGLTEKIHMDASENGLESKILSHSSTLTVM